MKLTCTRRLQFCAGHRVYGHESKCANVHGHNLAVFDHPKNYGHPSHWHIRDYGLYTANAFGLSHFEGKEHDGSKTWTKGENVEWNYRVYIHKGDTKAAKVAEKYRQYTTSPEITFE